MGSRAQPARHDPDDADAVVLVLDQDALLVAARDGRIIGTLIAGWDGWRGSIARFVSNI